MHNDCDLVFYIDYVMVLHDTTPIQPYKMSCNGRFVYWAELTLRLPTFNLEDRLQVAVFVKSVSMLSSALTP